MDLAKEDFTSYKVTIEKALDRINADKVLALQSAILIKPNLINSSPHPITTGPDCCEAIITYIQKYSKAKIVIAEGCGDVNMETAEVFELLGYTALAEKYGIPLIDLNHEPLQSITDQRCKVFPEMQLPRIAFDHYIVSVPVLKVHSLAKITGTLKNMMGFPPPQYYSGSYGSWKKAAFHQNMQQSIIDLNRYLIPDLTVMDCSIGMAEYHLGGPHCDPPVGKIIAGYNPWEIDQEACRLLGLQGQEIEHVAVGFSPDFS
ncbi:MAG: hypothetical protein ACI8ZB_000245 [Desulforhopalus sp.]|jgi:uncharacterized protein (DUF362 family)